MAVFLTPTDENRKCWQCKLSRETMAMVSFIRFLSSGTWKLSMSIYVRDEKMLAAYCTGKNLATSIT